MFPISSLRWKQRTERLLRWQHLGLCLLVLMTLALHFTTILKPSELAFDEVHYVTDARHIISEHETQRTEHPPLGKLFVVAGMLLFGDNALGWRFFSVIFGTICLVFFYLICRELGMPEDAVLIASFLLSLDSLSFVQAGVAMLDVYSLAFMLGALLLYLKGNYWLSGIVIGLSALAKLSGALTVPIIFLHWFFTGRPRPRQFLMGMFLAPASFVALMPLFDFAITHHLLNPIDRIRTMLSLSSSLTFAAYSNTSATRPWEWIYIPQIFFYWYDPHYVGTVSFTIWALIIPTVIYMAFQAKGGSSPAIFGLSWFASTYLFWIGLNLITDRLTFPYYFYQTVGAICIGLGLGLSQLLNIWKNRKTGKLRRIAVLSVSFYLLLHVGVFVTLAPTFSKWVKILELFHRPY
jgi:dolichyl-phosphate-mannose-protein mannosyltransferase